MALFNNSGASKLRSQEMAALQRALESERSATRAAQERAKELQQALNSERSTVRALQREATAQARAARDQEATKHAALVDQLKTRMELVQSEAVTQEREKTTRALTAQFQRELAAREEQWRLESRTQLETLQHQLRETLKASQQVTPQSQTDALVHALHADFHQSLRQKQEEWRKETKEQVDVLTCQLRDLQRLYTETRNQLTTTTNEAETIPKLRQEIQTLKLHNKELEEKIQILVEADRRKVEEFRALHEDNTAKMADLQRAARKETFQLLEELKGKDRLVAQLRRDRHQLTARVTASPYPRSRLDSEVSVRTRLDQDRPGEPPRLCIKRPKTLAFTPDPNKRQRAQEGRKPPDPPEPDTETTKKEDGDQDDNNKNTNSFEMLKDQFHCGPTADLINDWTKKVGVETLYQLLLREHQELQRTHHATCARLREEEKLRSQLEEQLRGLQGRKSEGDNAINLALAEQLQALTERQAELEEEVTDLREQNDLLEFRILELDDGVCGHSCNRFQFKSPPSRSPDTRDREMDDISDSGVMSLPTSEDISEADFQDFKMDNNRDVKSKLVQLCQSLESVSERISVQEALTLLRHYESRLETLEATLAAMCQEATQTKSFDHLPSTNTEHAKSPSRIIATVLPFTELSSSYNGKEARDDMPVKRLLRDQDCMQESGIFEDGGLTSCLVHSGTQTDWTFDPPPGDLGAEIRKLAQIRERIEEKGSNKKLLKTDAEKEFLSHASIKELLFYRERLQILEDKVTIYESRGDEQTRLLATRLEKEVLLAAQVKHLQSTVRHLKEVNRYLEEEKCEFEEAENDTRLRCQKLEVKLSALGEKKSDLQVQLQQNARTMSNLRSSLSEEERKRNEARQYAAKMEALVNRLEQQHFEMEEKEMEIRYRLHTLENIVPAMVMYYLWRMLNAIRPYVNECSSQRSIHSSTSDSVLAMKPASVREERSKKSRSNRQMKFDEQENLRRSLLEIEQFLSSKQKGENPESPRIGPDAAFMLIEELSDRCHALEDKIDELEIKEKLYQETLQKGDDILNKMEKEYKQQLRCSDEELIKKQSELEMARSQLRKLVKSREHELELQERVAQLEMELTQLQEASAQKEKDKKALEGDKLRLTRELEEALDNLDKFKENVEKPLSEEVENLKIRIRDLLGDLDVREQEKYETDEMHRKLVKQLKKINQQACRELEESEVTISELKEEVLTLEREVSDLRTGLSHERDRSERLLIQAGAELEARDRQLRSLDSSPGGSLREELLCAAAEHRVDHKSTADVPAAGTSSTYPPVSLPECDCQKAEQVVKEFDPNSYNISVDDIASAYQHSRTCRQCRSTTAVELSHIVSIVQKTASPSRIAQINHLLLLR